ncbi:MAG: SpoIIE family protein phosphatase [Bacteroidetes bacterium]|nr:SpoIIE family protein phosphatase [Bacteroidota bacterium]
MKRAATLLLFLFFCLHLSSQDKGLFRHYTIEDGLSQNSVFGIVQDKQGFMWMGTLDGVSRFDGNHFTIFRPDPNDSNSISHNSARAMLADREGNIWAGTKNGLNEYDPAKGKFKHYFKSTNGLAGNNILALAQDSSGNIWIGTFKEGISVLDPRTGKFTNYRHDEKNKNSLCGNDVRGICCAPNGHLWIATWSNGVCDFDPKKKSFTSYSDHEGDLRLNSPNSRGAICVDRKGRVWIGTWGRGIDLFDPSTGKMQYEYDSTGPVAGIFSGMVWSIHEDHKGNIWIATAENGLYEVDPSTWTWRNFRNDPNDPWTINDNNVWSVTEDKGGLIWTGGWQGGVNVYDSKLERFGLMKMDPKNNNSLPANTIWSFCSDGASGLWIGTSAGPVHYETATKFFEPPPLDDAIDHTKTIGAPSNRSNIQGMCRDHSGKIWMGTAGTGVHCYDPVTKTYQHWEPASGAPNNLNASTVTDIFCDDNGTVWIAAGYGDFQKYDPSIDGFINIPFEKSDSISPSNCVIGIAQSGPHHLVIGLTGGQVFDLDTKTNKYSLIWKNPNEIGISTIYIDKLGILWIGTAGSGLVYKAGNKIVTVTENDGLPNNVINGIAEGDHGEIWMSTNRGICCFDPAQRSVRTFSTDDGLQGNEFNQNAVFKSGDGRIWFGGVNGMNIFYPKDILPNQTPAPAFITGFSVLNKKYPLTQDILFTSDISLTYLDYFFSFDFAGLEFTNPKKNQFKYMMEGFDADWVDAGTRRFVTYTNLDPGEYTFRVRASNNDGYWGGKEAVIHITISPPFWRTKWFYTLCILSLILGVWLFIRRRERILRKEKEVLEEKVSERTFELQEEKEKVTAAHKDIRDSINYAQRIQYALLAHEELLKNNLAESFILFKPKDIVSGDFYWATLQGEKFYLAICDSTGHGVPGAFMSLLNISYLNEAIIEKKMNEPGKIFDHVRSRLIENISQDGGKDGMDAVLLCIDRKNNSITYAAAHNAPVIVRGQEIIVCETDKMPVGKGEKEIPFATRKLELQKGDALYLYTDGFADQFGGPLGKKFKEANLKKLLQHISSLPVAEQKQKMEEEFENWKKDLEQVDDVLVAGIRV